MTVDYPSFIKSWQFNTNQFVYETGSTSADNTALMLAIVNSLLGFTSNPWTVVGSSNNGVANTSNNWVPVVLSQTASLTYGSTTVTFSSNVTLPIGTKLTFGSQPGVSYYLGSAINGASTGTLVQAYSGSTTGGGQSVTALSLTWAVGGSTHSWIILKQAGITSNFQLLIALSNANTYLANVWVSPSTGFTPGSGSTTADPTIPGDATQLLTAGQWGGSAANCQFKVHAMQSSDGACTRLMVVYFGYALAYLSFEVPKNPVTGWTNPWVATWLGSLSPGTNQLSVGNLENTYSTASRSPVAGGTNFTLSYSSEWEFNGQLLQNFTGIPNDMNGEWPSIGVALFSNTAMCRGRHGELFDLWWGPSIGIGGANSQFQLGSAFVGPGGSYSYAQFGSIMFPWKAGTLPQWH